jgi:hypothetical protein
MNKANNTSLHSKMIRDRVLGDRVGDMAALDDFLPDLDGEVGGDLADDLDGELCGDLADVLDGDPCGDLADNLDGDPCGDLTDDLDGELGRDRPTDFEGELDGDFPVDFVGDTCDSVRFQRDLDVGDLEGECDDLVAAEALGVMASCRSDAPDVESF